MPDELDGFVFQYRQCLSHDGFRGHAARGLHREDEVVCCSIQLHFVTPAFQSDTFTTHGAVTWVLDNGYSGVFTTTATTAATTSRSFFRHTTSSAQVFYIEHTHRTHGLELIRFFVSDRLQQSDVGHEAVRRRSYWTELGMILAEPLARVSFELNALSGGQLGQHDVVVHGSDGLLAPILLMTLGLPHEVFG